MIKIENLTKNFGKNTILKQINLTIAKDEFCVLLGGSGSGKTTLLNILSGASDMSGGSVQIGAECYTSLVPHDKSRQIITQTYSLMPWLTARANIKFALKCAGIAASKQDDLVERYLHIVGLDEKGELFPHSLSGGQKQRVAIARALALRPSMLFLDEPFSALDPITRSNLQRVLKDMPHELTTIFVTHDIDEALFLADKIVVLHDGRIIKELRNPNFNPHDVRYFELKAQIYDLINGEDTTPEYAI